MDRMMRKHCLLLDIDISPLKEGFEFPSGEKLKYIVKYDAVDILNPELIKFFTDNIARISCVLVFHQGPKHDRQEIHIDGHGVGDIRPAVNWVLSDNYAMRWYIPKTNTTPKVIFTPADTPYFTYKLEDVTLVEETNDTGPWLTEVGSVAHNAINFSDKERWCISVRPKAGDFRDYDDLIQRFSPWIIEERK